MKKVLIIQESLGGGGAEKVLKDILDGVDYNNYEIDLALISNDDDIYSDKINKKVNIKNYFPNLNIKNTFFNKVYKQFKIWHVKYSYIYIPFLLKKDYDIEIAFLEGPSTEILARSKNKKTKKIAWVHTDLTKLRRISKEKEKLIYRKMDKVVTVSKDSKEKFLSLYPENEKKVTVLYNLINKKNILKLSKEKVEIELKDNTLIAVGRLNKQKRFDRLIKAHKKLLEDGVINNLLILGEGDERNSLENLIEELNLSSSVKLLGFKNNPYKYVKNSDIYVMSSDVEGLPLVVAEALTLGKVIVSTRCTGPMEMIGNNEYGILTKENSSDSLKESLKEILLDKEKQKYLEEKALERSSILDEKEFWKKFYGILEDS